MTTRNKIFSIGYQGRSIEAFCAALVDAGVRVLVDVRAAAWSQRPQYRKTALAASLREHGIDYIHCKSAGNPFRPKAGTTSDWQSCERLYAEHLDQHPEVVDALEEIVVAQPSALLCYEAHRSECHRGVILSRLEKRNAAITLVDL